MLVQHLQEIAPIVINCLLFKIIYCVHKYPHKDNRYQWKAIIYKIKDREKNIDTSEDLRRNR